MTDDSVCLPPTPDETQGAPVRGFSPAEEWDSDVAGRALDELFSLARQYKSSKAYRELLDFVARFRFYAPFNAMLLHVQMPGATFVAPPHRWLRNYNRRIKIGAHPLVILQPKGPVMFVFDVSETEPAGATATLPREVEQPFEVRGGRVSSELERTVENAQRDGVLMAERAAGSQSAGVIRRAQPGRFLEYVVKEKPDVELVRVPVRYELLLKSAFSREAQYATLVHELAHLYCGHLGTPNDKWWPDRRGLTNVVCEFEAESVSYLVCGRAGIDSPSAEYLAGYQRDHEETPGISLECVMKSAGLIQQMARERLKPRKAKE